MAIQRAPAPAAWGAPVVPPARAVHFPTPPPALPVTYAAAVDRYLAAARIGKSATWIHRISLTTWGWMFTGHPAPIGPARRAATPPPFPLTALGAPGLAPVLAELAATRAEAVDVDTVRRELSIARKAIAWWHAQGWLTFDPTVEIDRRPALPDPTRPLDGSQLEALWRMNAAVREMTLWKLLHESGAPADEVLALNVEYLNTPDRSGMIVAAGGALKHIRWASGTAELLPQLVAGRPRGPLFLSDRQASGWIPDRDRCPITGKARLSYRRAEEIFEWSTRLLANPLARAKDIEVLRGWGPLHRLRRSTFGPYALT
ncbi:site-specific recombinase [Streptomyces sp. 6N223]|uniref:site-specific recombinase n=1 Tax=Streptomyces sp. 6N223 TaxID=3457412 RepID=UPI003FCF35A2